MKITIINTGGTFNKRYNPIKGQLEVPKDNKSLEEILSSCYNVKFEIKNIISKDSLEIDEEDREEIVQEIKNSKNKKIIIIHGTDTIDLTAKFIEKQKLNKKIVLTGAMVPLSIQKTEAVMNFSQAIGFLNAKVKKSVYISMHGSVVNHKKIKKNRKLGQFLL